MLILVCRQFSMPTITHQSHNYDCFCLWLSIRVCIDFPFTLSLIALSYTSLDPEAAEIPHDAAGSRASSLALVYPSVFHLPTNTSRGLSVGSDMPLHLSLVINIVVFVMMIYFIG